MPAAVPAKICERWSAARCGIARQASIIRKARIATMQSCMDKKAKSDFSFPVDLIEGNGVAASSGSDKVFDRVRAQLKARLGSEVYSSWFGRMKIAESSKGLVRISVPTAFLRSWINGHYLDLIVELWKQEEPDVLKVDIIVRTATRHLRTAAIEEAAAHRA